VAIRRCISARRIPSAWLTASRERDVTGNVKQCAITGASGSVCRENNAPLLTAGQSLRAERTENAELTTRVRTSSSGCMRACQWAGRPPHRKKPGRSNTRSPGEAWIRFVRNRHGIGEARAPAHPTRTPTLPRMLDLAQRPERAARGRADLCWRSLLTGNPIQISNSGLQDGEQKEGQGASEPGKR
jgi:hypothetical protein